VASDARAVTIVRLAWVTGAVRVVPLRVGGDANAAPVAPTRETVRSLRYPLARPVVLYTRGAPIGDARALVEVALGPEGQTALERAGYVSR
jgi:phosphate transport system substrate-binding protein